MEDKHKKSKRSLNGDDVYELACRYDVGWSKSKKKRVEKDRDNDCERSDRSSEKSDKVSITDEDSVLCRQDQEGIQQHISPQSPVKHKTKIKTESEKASESSQQNDFEQDLHPLHTQWKFTKNELEELKAKGVKVKIGSWSKKEISILEKNMKEYLKENNITDPSPLILAENGRRGKDVKAQCMQTDFYRRLGKGIHRPLFHVYRRVLRMYNPENHQGRWSEVEIQDLLRFHATYGDQWTKIGSLLGRSGMSVHHKFLEMQKTHAGYWSEDEIERLDAAVRASTGTEFGSQIYGDINWVEVSTFVMTRTSDQCRKKWINDACWRIGNGVTNVKWNSDDDIKLIERLYKMSECDENDINWIMITKDLPKAPSVTWLRSKWTTLKKAVPNYTECDFEEILDYLFNIHRTFLKRKTEAEKDEHL